MSGTERPGAGWYDDPFGEQPFRWWDGSEWTPATATSCEAAPPADTAPRPNEVLLATVPFRTAGWALIAVIASITLGVVIAVSARTLGAPDAVVLGSSQIGLWTPMILACWYTSRRLGTGDLRADFGVAFERRDIVRGLGVWAVGLLSIGFVLQFMPEHVRRGGGNTQIAGHFRHDTPGTVVVLVIGILGAPLIEELFFRGLLLRSLADRLPRELAIAAQALIFGALHASPVRGVNNLSVVVATGLLGAVFGFSAAHYRRLGPGMVAHATQNSLALVIAVLMR